MLITGYNDVDNNINRWKIENSWGTKSGADGYLIMSNDWMKLYTFQALVKKSLLSQEELLALDDEMQILQPWDPLGTLA
jgi:bleomycin hydrolase